MNVCIWLVGCVGGGEKGAGQRVQDRVRGCGYVHVLYIYEYASVCVCVYMYAGGSGCGVCELRCASVYIYTHICRKLRTGLRFFQLREGVQEAQRDIKVDVGARAVE